MLNLESVLPAHSSRLERALERASLWSAESAVFADIWNPDTCPVDLLPWLAWSLSVDDWNADWPESTKRAVIKASFGVHRIKGTRKSLQDVLTAAGFPDAIIIEGAVSDVHDGTLTYNGVATYASGSVPVITHDGSRLYDGSEIYDGVEPAVAEWAQYSVRIGRAISLTQAADIRAMLESVAPARCHLVSLTFTEAANLYDAAINHDGTQTYGAA